MIEKKFYKKSMTSSKGQLVEQGSTGEFTRLALNAGIGNEKLPFCKVVVILDDDYHGAKIGIQSEKQAVSLHNLDGLTPEHTGYWISKDQIDDYLIINSTKYCIVDHFKFKNNDLLGKKCKTIGTMSDTEIMVEFEDNIQGTSGDGLGKKGHCIPIPISILGVSHTSEGNTSGNRSKIEEE